MSNAYRLSRNSLANFSHSFLSCFNAPIFTYENILIKAGVILKVENDEEQADSILKEIIHKDTKDSKKDYKNKTTEELQKLLKIDVLKENYENAALIRDEISKRQ